MATATPTDEDIEELAQRFEKWLNKKLTSPDEELMFANYIVSIVTDEDSSDEDKMESMKPLIQELNQNKQFEDEDQLCKEIIDTWNNMKQDEELGIQNGNVKIKQTGENPTDTILSMINKHKSQVDTKKSLSNQNNNIGRECDYAADYLYSSDKDEDSNDEENKKSDDLLENTNAQDAKNKEKLNREKIAETHAKQKEQSKKALVEQKEKEIEKKKQKQAKAAKVERKR